MYKKCLIFVGEVHFNLMNNSFIYPPIDGYMKKSIQDMFCIKFKWF